MQHVQSGLNGLRGKLRGKQSLLALPDPINPTFPPGQASQQPVSEVLNLARPSTPAKSGQKMQRACQNQKGESKPQEMPEISPVRRTASARIRRDSHSPEAESDPAKNSSRAIPDTLPSTSANRVRQPDNGSSRAHLSKHTHTVLVARDSGQPRPVNGSAPKPQSNPKFGDETAALTTTLPQAACSQNTVHSSSPRGKTDLNARQAHHGDSAAGIVSPEGGPAVDSSNLTRKRRFVLSVTEAAGALQHDSVEAPPTSELSRSEREDLWSSVVKINKHVKLSKNLEEDLASLATTRSNLVTVGVTGSGKSTLVNSLAGCEMQLVSQEECRRRQVRYGCLEVREKKYGGPRDAVSQIGFDNSKSETEILRPLRLDSEELVVWDCPGFQDTFGPEVNIANAVNVSRLLESSKDRGLVIMLVLDAPSIENCKGMLFRSSCELLVQLFGSKQKVRENTGSIIFCVTKGLDYELALVRGWVLKGLAEEGIVPEGLDKTDANLLHRIVVYDPLHRHKEGASRSELLALVQNAAPVRLIDCTFRSTLRPVDEQLLTKIALMIVEDIRHAMTLSHFARARTRFETFRELQVIAHPEIHRQKEKIQHGIRAQVDAWSGKIRKAMLKFDLAGRQDIREHLELLKRAEDLDELSGRPNYIKQAFLDLCQEVGESEARQQEKQCASFSVQFAAILEASEVGLRAACQDKAEELLRHYGAEPVSADSWKPALEDLQHEAADNITEFLGMLDDETYTWDTGFLFPDQEGICLLKNTCEDNAAKMVRRLFAQIVSDQAERELSDELAKFQNDMLDHECELGRAVMKLGGRLDAELPQRIPNYAQLWQSLQTNLVVLHQTAKVKTLQAKERSLLADLQKAITNARRHVCERMRRKVLDCLRHMGDEEEEVTSRFLYHGKEQPEVHVEDALCVLQAKQRSLHAQVPVEYVCIELRQFGFKEQTMDELVTQFAAIELEEAQICMELRLLLFQFHESFLRKALQRAAERREKLRREKQLRVQKCMTALQQSKEHIVEQYLRSLPEQCDRIGGYRVFLQMRAFAVKGASNQQRRKDLIKFGFSDAHLDEICTLLGAQAESNGALQELHVWVLDKALQLLSAEVESTLQQFLDAVAHDFLSTTMDAAVAANVVQKGIDADTEMAVRFELYHSVRALFGDSSPQMVRFDQKKKQVWRKISSAAADRVKAAEARQKQLRVEALKDRLSTILAAGEWQDVPTQNELVQGLDDLLDLDNKDGAAYCKMVRLAKTRMEQECRQEGDLESSTFCSSLVQKFQLLTLLSQRLKVHLTLDLSMMTEQVEGQVKGLRDKALSEIKADTERLSFVYIRKLVAILRVPALTLSFPKMMQEQTHQLWHASKAWYFAELERAEDLVRSSPGSKSHAAAHVSSNSRKVAILLIKGYGLFSELSATSEFSVNVRKYLLDVLDDREKYFVGTALVQYTESEQEEGISEMARAIIDTFHEFQLFCISLFNQKASAVSFEKALADIDWNGCNPPRPSNGNLCDAFAAYSETYSALVNAIVSQKFTKSEVLARIDKTAKSIDWKWLSNKPKRVGSLLGLICGLWSHLSAAKTKGIAEEKYVLQPHATQILAILRILGVDAARMQNHLIQIGTGEGKSVALGITAAVLAKLEVSVDVVCFNAYLSARDEREFHDLFRELQVLHRVTYGNFDNLANRHMSSGTLLPDVREAFNALLHGKQWNGVTRKGAQKHESVLLLDEVDVFFSDAFFGHAFTVAHFIGGEDAYAILAHAWARRMQFQSQPSHLSVQELLQLPASHSLTQLSGHFTNFLTNEFEQIVHDVRAFAREGRPALTGPAANYVVGKDGQIGYTLHGIPSFGTVYGYYTAFTYFYLFEVTNEIQEEAVKRNVQLSFICGNLIFSCLPNAYRLCIGMSGTLSWLSDAQKDLLKQYNLGNALTVMGSTFQRKPLNHTVDGHRVESEHTDTVVVTGDWEEYFQAILREVEYTLKNGRALLIVVADHDALDKFASEFDQRKFTHPQYQRPLKLSDRMRENDRQSVILRAIRKYAITLLTRSYGRGTDFVCRDKGLTNNGGVHMLVTFFPQDRSEEEQIKGRTCRQDDPGSYKKLLFQRDLEYLGATENDKEEKGIASWDEYLSGLREAKERDLFASMTKRESALKKRHDCTVDACRAVAAGRLDDAARAFEKIRDWRESSTDSDSD